jgi:competence protein ComEC
MGLPWWAWLGGGVTLGVMAALTPSKKKLPRERDPLQFSLLLAAALLLGAAALTFRTRPATEADLRYYNDTGWVTLEGTVVGTPDLRDTHINLRVAVEALHTDGEQPRPVEGLILAQADYGPTYRYGDRIRLRGQLRTPPDFAGFSYRDYLAREGVYSFMQYADVRHTGQERGGSLPLRTLFDLRQTAQAHITRLLPDPASSLLVGILLGIESGISADTRTAFNAVGATHVIAISGSNMVILAKLVERVSRRFLREKLTGIITIGVIFAYAVFVGADASVMRAALMVGLAVTASLIKRQTFALASLAFAGLLMTTLNPLILWDVGFQLSFLATLGLILYVDPLERAFTTLLAKLTTAEGAQKAVGTVSEAFIVTIAAQITTTPIIAYYFGRVSLLTLPVNFLIVPVQGPLMVLGGIGVMAAFVIEPLGQLILWGSYLFLSWTNAVVTTFAQWVPSAPEATLSLGETVLIYAVLFGGTAAVSQARRGGLTVARRMVPQVAAGMLTVALMLVALAGCALPDGRLHVRFLDVGESNATLLTSPSGRHILVDTGSSGRTLSAELGKAMPYWQRRVDVIVLTQARSDYVDSLRILARRYNIGAVMTNGTDDPDLHAILDAHDIPVVVAREGSRIHVGDGVVLTVLDAPLTPPPEDDLGDPLVLHVAYEDARYLLTGALREGQTASLSPDMVDITVLQAPRGGHRDVTTAELLQMTTPQFSIISINAGNRFSLPHREALARLADFGGEVYRTDLHGTVHTWTNGQQLWVKTEK